MRKPVFSHIYAKTKVQMSGNLAVDLHRCFRYIDSTIPLLFKFKFQNSSHPSSVIAWPG